MTSHLLSLGVGLVVGIAYGLLGVRSPAPPVVALLGLLGMLLGEQVAPVAKRLMRGEPLTAAAAREECAEKLFGTLPSQRTRNPDATEPPV
jgi:XapX domain-containing protein